MDSSRSMKQDVEDSTDLKDDRVREDEERNGSDKRKHRSNRSRKHSNVEEAEEWDSSERRSSGDRIESRKRSGVSSNVGSGDENEYDTRKELRSKLVKKNQEDKFEKKLSSGYQERETEGNRKGRDISGSKGHGIANDSERESSRKSGLKPPIYDSSQSRSRSKVNTFNDDQEKIKDRDSRCVEKKESSRNNGHGSQETYNNTKKRGDESDLVRNGKESNYIDEPESRSGKVHDVKHDSARDNMSDIRSEPIENKSKAGDSSIAKAIKSSNNNDEERKIDEKIRSRGRSDGHEDDNRLGSINREEKSGGARDDKLRTVQEKPSGFSKDTEAILKSSVRGHSEKIDTHRHQLDAVHGVHDSVDSRERSVNIDEDGCGRTRDRSGREIRSSKKSWSPERVGRRHPHSGESESDNERSVSLKGKERERESYRDDRSKGRDSSWNDRNKDHDGSKDNWKRRHDNNTDKDASYVFDFDHGINWDSQRRDHERNDNDKPHNHPGYRRTGRNEGGNASLNYGGGNRSSDMIEIRPTPIDYGREGSELLFTGKKTEGGAQKDYTSAAGNDQWVYLPEDKAKMTDNFDSNDDLQQRYPDDGLSAMDQSSGRNNMDMQGERGRGQRGVMGSNRSGGVPSPSSLSHPPFGNNQGLANFSRITPQGGKGSRFGRGGRGRLIGRDGQRVGMPMPMKGSSFGPLGFPPGPTQILGPNMSPGPGPPIVLGGFIPQFPGPNAWPGARGIDMNMLSVPHGVSPIPPIPPLPRFPLNVVTSTNPAIYFNQQGPVRGVSPSIPVPGYNATGTLGRGLLNDKALGNWNATRTGGPPGKAPSRGEQNDYSQNFVDTGMRPQNYIRELELTNTVEDYPKLRELIQRKDEIVAKSTTPPMYYKCDLREFVLSPEFFGTKFDVILVDPPWEEYVHRAPGSADHMEYWTFEEILNLKIEAIADTPSFIFLWVGDGVGLEQGRQCLRKWGFRRCEDICWVKTNKSNATSGLRHDSHTLFQHSKEHCLMGIKGTVRRSTDGHIIHANIDTDIVIAEESPYGSTAKPEDFYRIIEHFSLGRRRIELFGEDHNIRSGWLTVGKGLSSSDFNAEAYVKDFCDKDGKVWQGGGGRNPPAGAPHLVVTTPEIEGLRPKSPPQKNQQQQNSITLTQTTSNSTNRRPAIYSQQNSNILETNQEVSSANPLTSAQWASPMVSSKPPDTVVVVTEDTFFDSFGHDPLGGQANVDKINFGSGAATNVL